MQRTVRRGRRERLEEPTPLVMPPSAPVKPLRDKVIELIITEAAAKTVPCDESTAGAVIDLVQRAVQHTAAHPGQEYILTDADKAQVHGVLDVVMPDDRRHAPAGSAQEGIDTFTGLGEFQVYHTKAHDLSCALRDKLRSTA